MNRFAFLSLLGYYSGNMTTPARMLACAALSLLLAGGCGHRAGPSDPAASLPGADAVGPAFADSGPWIPPVISNETASQQEAAAADDTVGDDEEPGALDHALELVESAQDLWTAGERDHAIDALDQAYASLLKAPVDGSDKEELQQKEDLRFLISKRLMEIYATRFTAAHGTHNEIPLTLNEHVQREITLFQTQERDYFLESYRRSGKYRASMAKAFRDAGLPEDLAWLPLIESGYKVRALSRARALGLWQFIPSTGYKYGLKRNDWIDERLDPDKSTAAAIDYLKELHQMFGDWATVLAAYNCGEGSVLRAIRGQKIDYLDNFWDLYQRLPRETARYYPRFLATLAIVKDPGKYGFTLPEPDQPATFETVSFEKPVQLAKLADKIACDTDDLATLNPELRHQATPPGPYTLRVPPGRAEATLAAVDSLPKFAPPKSAYVVHRVRRGETLSTIAVQYRTSVSRIMDANNLRSARKLRVGQRLKIPLTRIS
jgi:membrane-bound lytic murein transglycosylase D